MARQRRKRFWFGVGGSRYRWSVIAAGVTVLLLYVGAYLALRAKWSQTWEKDGRVYVIFPENGAAIYYLYRPLSYADAALTGMRFHIGPHR